MSDAPRIVLQPLGDPGAAVCVDGVCVVPSPLVSELENRREQRSR